MTEFDVTLAPDELDRLRSGAVVVRSRPGIFRITGSGRVDCIQGLLTNDIARPGEASLVYGAMLTPKGMIVVDAWVAREDVAISFIVPRQAREATAELFAKTIPPRLARATDLSEDCAVAWLVGPAAMPLLSSIHLDQVPPAPGHVARASTAEGAVLLGAAPDTAFFAGFVAGPVAAVDEVVTRLVAAGAHPGSPDELTAARVLAGWPALGAEIDDRTLPQEVRYDEIAGVSYTKGCYTGQETVARLHFRGHPNRMLRGLIWEGAPPSLGDRSIHQESREVGTVRSTVTTGDRVLGLAVLRREVGIGDEVIAAGAPAEVSELPFPKEPQAA